MKKLNFSLYSGELSYLVFQIAAFIRNLCFFFKYLLNVTVNDELCPMLPDHLRIPYVIL